MEVPSLQRNIKKVSHSVVVPIKPYEDWTGLKPLRLLTVRRAAPELQRIHTSLLTLHCNENEKKFSTLQDWYPVGSTLSKAHHPIPRKYLLSETTINSLPCLSIQFQLQIPYRLSSHKVKLPQRNASRVLIEIFRIITRN